MIKTRMLAAIKKVALELESYPWQDERMYALWLSQAYYFVKHSTPMLALSAGHSVNNREYHLRCIDHLSEEKGHDKMLINDLKSLGYKPDDFSELAITQALYQTQYYWIEHKDPVSFLGYIALLEGLAVVSGKIICQKVDQHRGKSFLKVHSNEDPDHLEKALKMVDSFGPNEQRLIAENCELSAGLYLSMLLEMRTVSIVKAA